MPWFYVDDGFTYSKPVMNLPRAVRLEAVGLWTLAGAWSAHEETDGHVPMVALKAMGARLSVIRALCDPGPMDAALWERTENGIRFKNWEKWQKTSAELRENRKKSAEKMRRFRKGRNAVTSDDSSVLPGNTPVTLARMRVDPTRPLVVTKEGSVAVGSEDSRSGADAPPLPENLTCPNHPDGPDHDQPCVTCKRVRVGRDQQARKVAEDRAQAERDRYEWERGIHRCELCPDTGMLFRPGPHGEINPHPAALYIRCPHNVRDKRKILEAHAERVAETLKLEGAHA
jgi:hypothetical protein